MAPQSEIHSTGRRPLVHDLYEHLLSGPRIEDMSFEAIDRECQRDGFTDAQWVVVRRMIHTCADFTIASRVRFSPGAIESGVAALKRRSPVYVDSNMIRAGVSISRLKAVHPDYKQEDVASHVADHDIALEARESGLPRSLFAMRKARPLLDDGIVLIGNAPVALLELNRMIQEEGIRPALVVAMPVGFIHVAESKQELLSLDIPYILLEGRRGGSTLAVSVIHALATLAKEGFTEEPRQSVENTQQPAIILLGHGSRVPDAAAAMDRVAQTLRTRFPNRMIEIAHMSLAGPRLEEAFTECTGKGAREILVMPYFLHEGMHMKLDIPKILLGCVEKCPQVRCVLGKCLGYHESLADLVHSRIHESMSLPDIRQLAIVDIDSIPETKRDEQNQ